MNYELSSDQILLKNTVREFAEGEIKPVISELDEREEFSLNLVAEMGKLGLFGMNIPPHFGGQGMDALSYILAVEELARVDNSIAATLAAHNSLGIGPIYNFGNKEQKEKYLPMLTTGNALWSFGLTEPNAGSDSRGTQTKAVLENNNWIINGSKIFITNGASKITLGATVQAVTNTTEDETEYSAILVEHETNGVTAKEMHGKLMWRASNTAELFYEDCIVPEENLLGKRGEGSKIMLKTLDDGRLSIAALGLGLAQGAFEMALEYSKERKQFGRPISKFQAIAFKLADMATKIEAARNMLYKACWLKDNEKPFAKEAAMSKLYCSEIAKEVADEAVQIFGGYGLMREYNIERFYRDQRILQIGEGTSEIQRIVISRHLGL